MVSRWSRSWMSESAGTKRSSWGAELARFAMAPLPCQLFFERLQRQFERHADQPALGLSDRVEAVGMLRRGLQGDRDRAACAVSPAPEQRHRGRGSLGVL